MKQRTDPEYWRQIQEEITPPKAVVSGAGHTGTGYMTRLLAYMPEVRAAHEGYFNPWETRAPDLDVDVSWISAVALDVYEGAVWHQTREPLRTITSLAFTGAWSGPYFYMRRHIVRPLTGDRLVDAMTWYVDMNLKVEEHADLRWQVETIDEETVTHILNTIDRPVFPDVVAAALDRVPTNVNQHYRAEALSWDQLPDCPVKQELKEMAARYGYEA